MNLTLLTPRKSLNKAFLKIKPNRNDIERFKNNFIKLIDRINEAESEEFHKNLVSEFLKDTYYKDNYFINTKGHNDLVIHNGKDARSTVGVIIEAKKPTNKTETLHTDNINTKALQELVLYYLRERITQKNLEIKYLIATNIYEWFIFDAQLFERLFANNKSLIKKFTDFEEKRLADTRTDFFYKEIAEPFINGIEAEIVFTHFDIRDYKQPLCNADKQDDNILIALYKLLSPEHLLKLPFINDSNSLDKSFYTELLHIIGLTETKEGGKKLIGRKKEGERNTGSLMESVIIQLESLDKITHLQNVHRFGENNTERLFNLALELSITWINRILFLKLLEAQLINYNKGDKSYSFLNLRRVRNFDDLNSLFFQVLARKPEERNEQTKKLFAKVPYLNSSLFEPTEIEHSGLFISQLRDTQLPILGSTVLKDQTGKKRTGALDTLEYLFEFLDAYDFAGEGAEEIQEDNKTLINASVLGLIFEKINGYKDGSVFTPGFITMYMCRGAIRRAVLQKFKERYGWHCADIDDLKNYLADRKSSKDKLEFNAVINTLRICDPAVGSGHFLVSALNEIILIKHELGLLVDDKGARLSDHEITIENDELIVTDENGKIFEYNPKNTESRRIQETLFHEKQTIIENCLFGVDINPNSVNICRLRLWIELLKNAYYKAPDFTELETLPNIDINIKCGNSLISRYLLDANIKEALKRSGKWTIEGYRLAVMAYRNAKSKDQKRAMEKLIAEIKGNFESEVASTDKRVVRLKNLKDELKTHATQTYIFELSKVEKAAWEAKLKKLTAEIKKLETAIEEIKSNKIYENAFEWRFEFPEVLNDDGEFVGFDVVIGNPPYIRQEEIKDSKPFLQSQFKLYTGTSDIYIFFIEKGFDLLKRRGFFAFIMPNKFMQAGYGKPARGFLLEKNIIEIIDFGDYQIFQKATTYPCILTATNEQPDGTFRTARISSPDFITDFPDYVSRTQNEILHTSLSDETWIVSASKDQSLLQKIILKSKKLENYIGEMGKYGLKTGLTEAFVIGKEKAEILMKNNPRFENHIKPFLLGREIKPYLPAKPSNYLIKFEKGFTNKNGGKNPEKWFQNQFPELHQHLAHFEKKATERTDQGDYYWELRACDYYDKFEKPKIMYQKFQVKPCFIYDVEGLFCNDSMWIIPTDDKVLLGILNSKLGWWLISKYCTAIQNGYQLIWKYFSQIPIVTGDKKVRSSLNQKVNAILEQKKNNSQADTSSLEKEIDQLVYQLYGLTEEEIKIVEQN